MEWNQVRENWPQFQYAVQHEWSRLLDFQLEVIAGDRNQLIAKVQLMYQISLTEAQAQVANWQNCKT